MFSKTQKKKELKNPINDIQLSVCSDEQLTQPNTIINSNQSLDVSLQVRKEKEEKYLESEKQIDNTQSENFLSTLSMTNYKEDTKSKNEKNTKIKALKTKQDLTITALGFFKYLPQEIRCMIGNFLTEKDIANLYLVSKDFHGPVEIKSVYKNKWGKGTFDTLIKPTRAYAKKIKEGYHKAKRGGSMGAANPPSVLVFPVFGLFNFVVAGCASVPGLVAGSIKDKSVKTHGKNFKGEKITFK